MGVRLGMSKKSKKTTSKKAAETQATEDARNGRRFLLFLGGAGVLAAVLLAAPFLLRNLVGESPLTVAIDSMNEGRIEEAKELLRGFNMPFQN